MATKTMILRPIAVGTSDESLVSFYPTSTTINNAHLLVNEEVADDDSTYITLSVGGAIQYHFNYIRPLNMISINKIYFYFRLDPEKASTNSSGNTTMYKLNIEGNSTSISMQSNMSGTRDGYELVSITSASNSTIINNFNEFNEKNFYIEQSIASSNKNNPMKTTQAYIEIVYEYDETIPDEPVEPEPTNPTFYIKSNNIWEPYIPTYYKKENNIWILVESSIFTNESKYIIKNIEEV